MPYTQYQLQDLAERMVQKSAAKAVRRKCFVSYHSADSDEVADFIEGFGSVFIPKIIGVSEDDAFIDSGDSAYVYDTIREKYLTDSSVTIVLVGECTWSRRFVDWEIASTLRNDPNNRRGGLMAVTLPSMASDPRRRLPERLTDNIDGEDGYARWWKYPKSESGLREMIETVYGYRTSRVDLVVNSRARRVRSAACP